MRWRVLLDRPSTEPYSGNSNKTCWWRRWFDGEGEGFDGKEERFIGGGGRRGLMEVGEWFDGRWFCGTIDKWLGWWFDGVAA